MSVVVSDTSPIVALCHLQLSDLLERRFGSVLIPPAVDRELASPNWRAIVAPFRQRRGVRVQAPVDRGAVDRWTDILDAGEAEAIALAMEVGAIAVLMDERAGRVVASRVGLNTIGVLGLLLQAKRDGMVGELRPLIAQLRDKLKFHLSVSLEVDVLRQAGE